MTRTGRAVWSLAGTLAALLPLGAPLQAQAPIPSGSVAAGRLSFDGRATLGDFTGATNTMTGRLVGGSSLAEVTGWVEAPVKTLLTGNDKRDRDMNKSMESDKYPSIRFDLARVVPGAVRGDTTDVTLEGRFTIHGVEREATLAGHVVIVPASAHLRVDTPLNLKDYRIGGLSKMLGLLKMHEDIVVHVDVVFTFEPPPPAPAAPALLPSP